jgi:hypothetical protein
MKAIKVIKGNREYIMHLGAIQVALEFADSYEVIEVEEGTELTLSTSIIETN